MSMFFLIRVFAFVVVVALHRVCIRTLMSRMDLARCRLGFERRVDAAIYQTVFGDQNAHEVIGTRYRRNG
jgi:hypothetical protein